MCGQCHNDDDDDDEKHEGTKAASSREYLS